MAGKKGMKHYEASYKAKIVQQIKNGEITIKGFSCESGISRYALQQWCRESEGRKQPSVKRRGRPRTRPLTTQKEYEQRIKQLEMEVELLRTFLQAAGRK
jgi:transposase-like protein